MLKTIQWNIGGGLIHSPESGSGRYDIDGFDYIAEYLAQEQPDIITLQETHAKEDYQQVSLLAQQLGYPYFFNDEYADSHLTPGFRLGQGVISRFPIAQHRFSLFFNPEYQVHWEETGELVTSHDKGVSSCDVVIDGEPLTVTTLHAIPFSLFGIDPLSEQAREVRTDMEAQLRERATGRLLLQGDFNYNQPSLAEFFPLFISETEEAVRPEPTTPTNKFYDHVVFRGLRLIQTGVDNQALTDHYPVVSVFET